MRAPQPLTEYLDCSSFLTKLNSRALRCWLLSILLLLAASKIYGETTQNCKQQFAALFAQYALRFNSTDEFSRYLQNQFNSSGFGACILSPYSADVEIVSEDEQNLVSMLKKYTDSARQVPASAFAHVQLANFPDIENFIIKNFNMTEDFTVQPHGFIYDTRSLGFLKKTNKTILSDLLGLLTSQQSQDVVQQNDLLNFVSQVTMNWKGSPVALPFDGDILLLYYRQDLFSKLSLAAPATWADLLTTAQALQQHATTNPTDLSDAFCISGCKAPYLMVAIAGQYIQYRGTLSGFFYDPYTNLTTPVGSAGMVEAMKIFKQLVSYMPSAASSCEEVEQGFLLGKCGMTLGWGSTFKAVEHGQSSSVKGKVWAAPLPGSAKVFNREAQQLQDCTAQLCPFAIQAAGALVNKAAYAAINPFTGSYLLSVNGFYSNSSTYFKTASSYLMTLASPSESFKFVLDPTSSIDPFRNYHLDPHEWEVYNYTMDASVQYLDAVNASLSSGNVIAPLRFPIWRDVDIALKATAFELLSADEPDYTLIATGLADKLTSVLYNSTYTWKNLTDWYNFTMGFKTSMYDEKGNPGGNQSMSLIPAIVIPALLVVFLIVGTSVAVMYIRRDRRRSVLGRIMAPGAGPDTSLVVTDIQDSTAMWEQLPSEVMDRAVKEHHKCIRKILQKHYGYESTTEGDSFILAFHTAKDALLFAMEAQQSLMKLDWPPEVLALDWCKVLLAQELKTSYYDPTKIDAPHVDFEHNDGQQPAAMPEKSVDVFSWMLSAIRAKESHNNNGNVSEVTKQEMHLHVPELQGTHSLKQVLQATWKEAEVSDRSAQMVFRGMRVRIGIHTGVSSESHVQLNQTDLRVHYTGESMQLAKYVSDAGRGGMVTISEATYQKLPMEELFDKLQVVHCGEHDLSDDLDLVYIYQMLPRNLMGRLAFLDGIRSKMVHAPSTLDAPMGRVTIVFMNVVGVQMLLSWNSEVTKQSIKMFHRAASEELRKFSGHQVEQANNLFLASFPCQYQAVLWCLETQQRLKKMAWPVDLINKELDQEEIDAANGVSEEQSAPLYRGLHSKAGIDCSDTAVRGYINPITGRITYRGKVMNRAARIASMAQKEEVLCSYEVFQAMRETRITGSHPRDHDVRNALGHVEAESRGQQRLKGVADKMEIMLCRYKQPYAGMGMSRRASALGPTADGDYMYQQQVERVLSSPSFMHRAATQFGQLPSAYVASRPFLTTAGDALVHAQQQQLLLTDADLQAMACHSPAPVATSSPTPAPAPAATPAQSPVLDSEGSPQPPPVLSASSPQPAPPKGDVSIQINSLDHTHPLAANNEKVEIQLQPTGASAPEPSPQHSTD